MKDNDLGIYSVSAKKFFYLETGNLKVHNPIPRLRNTLQQRGLIDFNPQTYMNTNDYQIVTVKQAKLNDWAIEPIYISDHIRAIVTGKSSSQSQANAPKRKWGTQTEAAEPQAEATAEAPKPKRRRTKKKTETEATSE